MDTGKVQLIAGVATKGRAHNNGISMWCTQIKVKVSIDGNTWDDVDDAKSFTANSDRDTLVKEIFSRPVMARYIRIVPAAMATLAALRCGYIPCGEHHQCGEPEPAAPWFKSCTKWSNTAMSPTGNLDVELTFTQAQPSFLCDASSWSCSRSGAASAGQANISSVARLTLVPQTTGTVTRVLHTGSPELVINNYTVNLQPNLPYYVDLDMLQLQNRTSLAVVEKVVINGVDTQGCVASEMAVDTPESAYAFTHCDNWFASTVAPASGNITVDVVFRATDKSKTLDLFCDTASWQCNKIWSPGTRWGVPGPGPPPPEWMQAATIAADGFQVWQYSATTWTSSDTLDSAGNIKNEYWFRKSNAIKLVIQGSDGHPIEYTHNLDKSLQDIFLGGSLTASIPKATWTSWLPEARTLDNCNKVGFNQYATHSGIQAKIGRVRFGILMNNENDCATTDATIGIGNNRNCAAGSEYFGNAASSKCRTVKVYIKIASGAQGGRRLLGSKPRSGLVPVEKKAATTQRRVLAAFTNASTSSQGLNCTASTGSSQLELAMDPKMEKIVSRHTINSILVLPNNRHCITESRLFSGTCTGRSFISDIACSVSNQSQSVRQISYTCSDMTCNNCSAVATTTTYDANEFNAFYLGTNNSNFLKGQHLGGPALFWRWLKRSSTMPMPRGCGVQNISSAARLTFTPQAMTFADLRCKVTGACVPKEWQWRECCSTNSEGVVAAATVGTSVRVAFIDGKGTSAVDAVKVVDAAGSCLDQPAAVTDGQAVLTGMTDAASVRLSGELKWNQPGTYKFCYKLGSDGVYTEVGKPAHVAPIPPSNASVPTAISTVGTGKYHVTMQLFKSQRYFGQYCAAGALSSVQRFQFDSVPACISYPSKQGISNSTDNMLGSASGSQGGTGYVAPSDVPQAVTFTVRVYTSNWVKADSTSTIAAEFFVAGAFGAPVNLGTCPGMGLSGTSTPVTLSAWPAKVRLDTSDNNAWGFWKIELITTTGTVVVIREDTNGVSGRTYVGGGEGFWMDGNNGAGMPSTLVIPIQELPSPPPPPLSSGSNLGMYYEISACNNGTHVARKCLGKKSDWACTRCSDPVTVQFGGCFNKLFPGYPHTSMQGSCPPSFTPFPTPRPTAQPEKKKCENPSVSTFALEPEVSQAFQTSCDSITTSQCGSTAAEQWIWKRLCPASCNSCVCTSSCHNGLSEKCENAPAATVQAVVGLDESCNGAWVKDRCSDPDYKKVLSVLCPTACRTGCASSWGVVKFQEAYVVATQSGSSPASMVVLVLGSSADVTTLAQSKFIMYVCPSGAITTTQCADAELKTLVYAGGELRLSAPSAVPCSSQVKLKIVYPGGSTWVLLDNRAETTKLTGALSIGNLVSRETWDNYTSYLIYAFKNAIVTAVQTGAVTDVAEPGLPSDIGIDINQVHVGAVAGNLNVGFSVSLCGEKQSHSNVTALAYSLKKGLDSSQTSFPCPRAVCTLGESIMNVSATANSSTSLNGSSISAVNNYLAATRRRRSNFVTAFTDALALNQIQSPSGRNATIAMTHAEGVNVSSPTAMVSVFATQFGIIPAPPEWR